MSWRACWDYRRRFELVQVVVRCQFTKRSKEARPRPRHSFWREVSSVPQAGHGEEVEAQDAPDGAKASSARSQQRKRSTNRATEREKESHSLNMCSAPLLLSSFCFSFACVSRRLLGVSHLRRLALPMSVSFRATCPATSPHRLTSGR